MVPIGSVVATLRLGIRQPPSADRAVQPHLDQHLRTLRVFPAPAQRAWAPLLYFYAIFQICAFLLGDGALFLLGVAFLSLNPFLLDYLCLARGYSLGLALFLYALYQLMLYLSATRGAQNPNRLLNKAGIAIGLSIGCNVIMIFPDGRFGTGLLRPADCRMDAGQAGARRTRGRRGATAQEEERTQTEGRGRDQRPQRLAGHDPPGRAGPCSGGHQCDSAAKAGLYRGGIPWPAIDLRHSGRHRAALAAALRDRAVGPRGAGTARSSGSRGHVLCGAGGAGRGSGIEHRDGLRVGARAQLRYAAGDGPLAAAPGHNHAGGAR